MSSSNLIFTALLQRTQPTPANHQKCHTLKKIKRKKAKKSLVGFHQFIIYSLFFQLKSKLYEVYFSDKCYFIIYALIVKLKGLKFCQLFLISVVSYHEVLGSPMLHRIYLQNKYWLSCQELQLKNFQTNLKM